jgi:hypothetical protein
MRIRMLLLLTNVALLLAAFTPLARNSSFGWSDGHI